MEWKIEYWEKDKIVFACLTGDMDWVSHKQFAEEVFPFAIKKKARRVLIDFRDVTAALTILQIDDLPKILTELGVGPDFRIAALHDPKSPQKNEFDFFRNTASLMSIQVRHFASKDEAVEWLKTGV